MCPRAPRLTSVLDPGWLPVVGDMMCDGVFRQMVLRPLILSGPFPGAVATLPQTVRRSRRGGRPPAGLALNQSLGSEEQPPRWQ